MKLLLALVTLALLTTSAQAEEIPRYILIQNLSHVREVCADPAIVDEIERQLRAGQGCVTFQVATDDPNDVICIMHVPRLHDRPWDQEALIEALRPLCENTEEAGN